MRSVLVAGIVAAVLCVPVLAIDNPHVAGEMQGWDPAADPMVETAPGSGIYEITFTGLTPGGRYEFKITDGTWDNAIPSANSWCFADANGEITITYDSNTYDDGWSPTYDRIALSTDPGTWTAAGSFQGWDNADPASAMTDQGDGVYLLELTDLPLACYFWKPVVTGSWDSISWDGRSVNTADMEFCPDLASDTVRLWVDSFGGTVRVDIIHACPGDLDDDGQIGLSDLSLMLAHYGMTEGAFYVDGDIDGDGDVDLADLSQLLAVYGTQCG